MKLIPTDTVLLVQPKLAMAVGMNEAMFLQQLHYWLEKCGIEKEGKRWIYNAYSDWQTQFPFWSESTITRTIKRLEKMGIVVTGNFNKFRFDKTKWYRINYEQLQQVIGTDILCATSCQNDVKETSEGSALVFSNVQAPSPNMTAPIQKSTEKDINNIQNYKKVFATASISITDKQLEQIAQLYSLQDVERAVQEATKRRVLSVAYVRGILKIWQQRPRPKESVPSWFENRHQAPREEPLNAQEVQAVQAQIAALYSAREPAAMV